ncbi:MAG: YceH family protein [Bryobacteraceae bacterium]
MITLSHEEIRVLGALVEKDMATPEYYPLSINALVNACNQKTNREPMTAYSSETVEDALASLRAKQLSTITTGGSNRVPKFGHRTSETWNVNNRELAVLCVLMLRGAQTLNELKTRTESLYRFDDLDAVENTLQRLAERGFVVLLPKQAGMREPRWTHLIAGEPVQAAAGPAEQAHAVHGEPLTARVERLEFEVEQLRAQFEAFKKQFEG